MNTIFEEPEECPCIMKKDMGKENDILDFIEFYYPENDDPNRWYQLPPAFLKCTHCIFSEAFEIVKNNNQKYDKMRVSKLVQSLCIISSQYNYFKGVDEMIKERSQL